MRNGVYLTGLLALTGLATGCGAGKPGELVAPEAPTASEALEETESLPECGGLATPVAPLVVDWKSSDRTDLEAAMKQGMAVVSYDCTGIKLLESCQLSGGYDFAAVTPKEDVIQIASKDELWANLPLSIGKLEAELSRGSSIDLAIMLVGKRNSVRTTAARPELEGRCDGATHYVRAAHVGAFVMSRGEKGQVKAAAELFGVGTGGQSESNKSVKNRDGEVSSCKQAASDSAAPPAKCGAAIRLLLEPIVEARDPAKGDSAPPPENQIENPCPEGWAMASGKCVPQAGKAAKLCDGSVEGDCEAQCNAGSIESCYRWSSRIEDLSKRQATLKKTCDAGLALGCSALGDLEIRNKAVEKGLALKEKACALGNAWVCWNTGNWYLAGRGSIPKDPNKAAFLVQRGCSLGYAPSCATYGDLQINGTGVKQDVDAGLAQYQKLCDNGQGYYCQQLGSMYATDRKALADIRLPAPKNVKRDVPKGIRVWEQGCAVGSVWSCTLAGTHYLKGDGTKKDPARAKQLFERACDGKSFNRQACESLGSMYDTGNGVTKDAEQAVKYYERSCPSKGCDRAVEMLSQGKGIAKDVARARVIYEKQCRKGVWGGSELCYDFGKLLEAEDKAKALDYYADHCGRMGTELVGGKKVSAAKTIGGKRVLARSCQRLQKLDKTKFVETLKWACMNSGILCKDLEKSDRAAAKGLYIERCQKKKLSCKDAERLGAKL